jgi:hypothetical protein
VTSTISRQGRWMWRAAAAVLLLAMVATAFYSWHQYYVLRTVAGSPGGDFREAPCLPGEPVEIMDSPHISEAEAEAVRYNSLPPTSGPHFPFTVSPGIYSRPVPEGLTVHAMEHGKVIIQYAHTTSDDDVAQLGRLARRYGADVVLAPYPPLTDGIALTAWGRLEVLESYDEGRIVSFIEALRGRYHHGWQVDEDCPE